MADLYQWLVATGYYTHPADPGPERFYPNPHSFQRDERAYERALQGGPRQEKCRARGCQVMVIANKRRGTGLCRHHAVLAWHRAEGHNTTKEKIT